jgi:Spy/CpxP family protein refolding chaperone
MKKFLIFILTVFSFSFAQECSKYFLTKDFPLDKFIENNKEYLDITMEQEEAIQAVKAEYEPKIEERKNQIEALEKEYEKLVLKGGNSQRLKEILVKLAQLKAENSVLRIKEIRAIQNSLTKEQYQKLLQLLKEEPI